MTEQQPPKRRRRGPKPIPKEFRAVARTITMPPELWTVVEALSDQHTHGKASPMIRRMLLEWLASNHPKVVEEFPGMFDELPGLRKTADRPGWMS